VKAPKYSLSYHVTRQSLQHKPNTSYRSRSDNRPAGEIQGLIAKDVTILDSVRILIADDHPMVREGLQSMLSGVGFEVVGEAATGREALELATKLKPSIVLMDVRMPDLDGLEATRLLHNQQPGLPIIIVTTYENPAYMAKAVAAGAAGYILKGSSRDELLHAVTAAAEGGMLWDRSLMQQVVRKTVQALPAVASQEDAELVEPLTTRESEILALIAQGMNNREISEILSVTVSTVKTHIEHILSKLKVSDRVQAAVWAVRHGYIE
jgi:DNA-binding NarL/FixJ family response regulator